MRRSDREVKKIEEIVQIIEKCKVMRLGFTDGKRAYIVPLNFGFETKNGVLTFYFHCGHSGRKLDMMAQNPLVCFEMDTSHKLSVADNACRYTYFYESVMGEGTAEVICAPPEKAAALTLLMQKQTGKTFLFGATECGNVTVFKVTAQSLTAKAHREGR